MGEGVRNATVEDVSVEAFTTQNAFFMAPTLAGARVSRDVTGALCWTNFLICACSFGPIKGRIVLSRCDQRILEGQISLFSLPRGLCVIWQPFSETSIF